MSNNHQIDFKLENAKKFAFSGKPLHAVQLYKSLIDEYPDELEPYFQLAQLYQDQNLRSEAEHLLLRYLNLHKNEIDVILYLAQLYMQNSKWEEMIEILQPITPDEEPAALFLLGYAYFKQGNFEISKINFENFLKYNSEPEMFYETQLYLAKIFLEQKNYDKALIYAAKSEKFYSNYWELKYIYAKIYLNNKMINHAIENIEECIKNCTANFNVYLLAGEIYLQAKEYSKSEEFYLKCLNLNENSDSDLYIKLAEISLKNNKINDAINYYDIVLSNNPKHNPAVKGKKVALSLLKNHTH